MALGKIKKRIESLLLKTHSLRIRTQSPELKTQSLVQKMIKFQIRARKGIMGEYSIKDRFYLVRIEPWLSTTVFLRILGFWHIRIITRLNPWKTRINPFESKCYKIKVTIFLKGQNMLLGQNTFFTRFLKCRQVVKLDEFEPLNFL